MQTLSPCQICGPSETRIRYNATLGPYEDWQPGFNPYSGHYQINECRGCGLIHSSPIFDDSSIAALYRDYPETNVDATEVDNVRATMVGYYRMARPYITRWQHILDVGCDIGLLLDVAREDGFCELHGIEPVAIARNAARERLPGAHLYADFYQDCRFSDNHFDLITFVHVVDHLVQPVEVLERAYRNLAPGGLVVAVVHNIEAPLARLMGERFPVYNFFHHYFFSKVTLVRIFERCGFEIMTVRATRNCYSLSFLIDHFPLLPSGLVRSLSRWSRTFGVGRISLNLPIGNIGIVARKPAK